MIPRLAVSAFAGSRTVDKARGWSGARAAARDGRAANGLAGRAAAEVAVPRVRGLVRDEVVDRRAVTWCRLRRIARVGYR